MTFYVYLLITKQKNKLISYVGYSSDLKKRLKLHNLSKGAKFTKGKKWRLVYYRKYESKISAMKSEYKLKKNYRLRNDIKKKALI